MAPVCKHKKTVIPRGIQPWDFGFNLESAEECFKTFKKKKLALSQQAPLKG
jgi:hypothetical protein